MALATTEAFPESRECNDVVKNGKRESQVQRVFYVFGTDDPEAAFADGSLPKPSGSSPVPHPSLPNLYLVNRKFETHAKATASSTGCVKMTLYYGDYDKLEDQEEDEVDLDTESAHIENAISELDYFGTPTSLGLLIGVNDGKVDGVDIQVPYGKYSYSGWIDSDVITEESAINAIEALVGCQNDAPFGYWNSGEVLFLGAKIAHSGSNNGKYKVTFNFAIRLTETINVTFLGDGSPTEIDKDGWDYIWFERLSQSDGGTPPKLKYGPTAAHLVQVYYTGDFSTLETLIGAID